MKAQFLLPLFLMVTVLTTVTTAQTTEYTVNKESEMVIEGTSTIHDWEATVEKMDFSITVDQEAEKNQYNPQSPFSSVLLEVPVKSLESGKGKMNSKIYDALKEKKHPTIKFKLAFANIKEGDISEGEFTLAVSGDLSIAGINRRIEFPVKANKLENDTFTVKGSYDMNMKDYKVDPPSAMLGTIKSGEEITISFDLQLEPGNAQQTVSN